jgi:hypothetical protein
MLHLAHAHVQLLGNFRLKRQISSEKVLQLRELNQKN